MKLFTKSLLITGALILPSTALGQEGRNTPAQDATATKARQEGAAAFVTMEKIEGCEVQLARTTGEDEAPKATITDVLVSKSSGDLHYAVLKCDGHKTLVPFSHLKWSPTEDCFTTQYTKQQIEAMSAFDVDDAKKSDLEAAAKACCKDPVTARDTSDDKEGDTSGVQDASFETGKFPATDFVYSTRGLCLGSELDELELYGHAVEFGGVTRSIIDCNTGRVEYFVVSHGGVAGIGNTKYLIPFSAVSMCAKSAEQDAEPILCISQTEKELKQAPEYSEPKDGILAPELAQRSRTVFTSKD